MNEAQLSAVADNCVRALQRHAIPTEHWPKEILKIVIESADEYARVAERRGKNPVHAFLDMMAIAPLLWENVCTRFPNLPERGLYVELVEHHQALLLALMTYCQAQVEQPAASPTAAVN